MTHDSSPHAGCRTVVVHLRAADRRTGAPTYAASATGAAPADNPEIKALVDADQEERATMPLLDKMDDAARREHFAGMTQRDRERRDAVLRILRAGDVKTVADHGRTALVLQHGAVVEYQMLAFALATMAAQLDPKKEIYRWLSAAELDRVLVCKQRTQWYGTQFVPDPATGRHMLAPVVEGAVTDDERAARGVPPVAESREMERKMNASKLH